MMATFKIYQDESSKYSILLKNNNRILFFSSKHKSKQDCFYTIKKIKRLSNQDKSYLIKRISCGSWLFQFVDTYSKEILGESKTFISNDVLKKQVLIFKEFVQNAKIDNELYSL